MRVLVTGAAGAIGRVLVAGLPAGGHEVRGIDRVPAAPGAPQHTVGDVGDPAVLASVVGGAEAVVHLAAVPHEDSFAVSMDSHVTGTWRVLEAARTAGVQRVVLASSNHAVGRTPRQPMLGVGTRPRPDTYYGAAKVAAEALCSLYADRHGITSVSLRIGSFLERPTSRRHLSTWLSPHDAVRLVHAAMTADLSTHDGYTTVWGVSGNTRSWWDPAPGAAIGYSPRDDAEEFAEQVLSTPPEDRDESEARWVGGPYATAPLGAPQGG